MRKRTSLTLFVCLFVPLATMGWQSAKPHPPRAAAPPKSPPQTQGAPHPGSPEMRRPDVGSQNTGSTSPVGAQPKSVHSSVKTKMGNLEGQTANQRASMPAQGPEPNLGSGNGGKETPVGAPPADLPHPCISTSQAPCPRPKPQVAPKPAPTSPNPAPKD